MAGVPKIQNAQYGDSAKLEQLGSVRTTNDPAADVQAMKTMEGGRPVETDPIKLATRTMQQAQRAQGQASPEQERYGASFTTLGKQHQTISKWIRLANSEAAGPVTRTFAMLAIKAYVANIRNTRKDTPFFTEG